MKKEKWITVLICMFFVLAAGILYSLRGTSQPSEEFQIAGQTGEFQTEGEETVAGREDENKDADSQTDAGGSTDGREYAVDICGAVKRPGVYRFSGDARVCDAVKAAGGFRKSADTESVNQARYLTDGEQIRIPTRQETKKSRSQRDGHAAESDGEVSREQGFTDCVNINQAGAEELMTLPGIGEAKAKLIIDYRTEHGSFQSKEDIMKISGIKEGVYRQIKDKITVNWED